MRLTLCDDDARHAQAVCLGVRRASRHDLNFEIRPLPALSLPPKKREQDRAAWSEIGSRQVGEVNTETRILRVQIVRRLPLVARPVNHCWFEHLDTQVLAGDG